MEKTGCVSLILGVILFLLAMFFIVQDSRVWVERNQLRDEKEILVNYFFASQEVIDSIMDKNVYYYSIEDMMDIWYSEYYRNFTDKEVSVKIMLSMPFESSEEDSISLANIIE